MEACYKTNINDPHQILVTIETFLIIIVVDIAAPAWSI